MIEAIKPKKITPREGILVPLPDGNGNLPPEGKILTLNSYWYQRKFDGDVTIEEIDDDTGAPETPAPPAAKPKAK